MTISNVPGGSPGNVVSYFTPTIAPVDQTTLDGAYLKLTAPPCVLSEGRRFSAIAMEYEAATLSGVALDEEGDPWGPCDGSTQNIGIVVDAAVTYTSCDDTTGAFTSSCPATR